MEEKNKKKVLVVDDDNNLRSALVDKLNISDFDAVGAFNGEDGLGIRINSFNNKSMQKVILLHNNELLDENGNEVEENGIKFCQSLFGDNTRWVQTSYNGKFRKRFASPGDAYLLVDDAFVPNSPGRLYTFDNQTKDWIIADKDLNDIMEKLNGK